jgi:hypothetical protein
MTNEDGILIDSLAGKTALFEPMRDFSARYWPAVWSLRERYNTRGLPWHGSGDKAAERALAALVRRRLVLQRRALKTVAIRLSTEGVTEAFRLLGIGRADALAAAREVAGCGPVDSWIPETALNNGRGWGDGHHAELKTVWNRLAPATALGWLESHTDTQGHVGYRVTKSGLAEIARPTSEADQTDEPAPEALDHFEVAYGRWIAWFNGLDAAAVGARGDIGAIPLPATVWAATV